MNYDAEIARLIDLHSDKLSKLTGKPEHRKKAARSLLVALAADMKRLIREGTLQFYESRTKEGGNDVPLFPSVVPVNPTVTMPPPPTTPPVWG